MKMIKIPNWFNLVFPNLIWRFKKKEKTIYLTFDDGPSKDLTNWILKELDKFNAKATFCCLGKNVKEYNENFNLICEQGHQIGNHTYNHLNGWISSNRTYLEDIKKCQKLTKTKLFRPPFGRISPLQIRKLKKEFKIIMWDVNCWDFDRNRKNDVSKILKSIDKGSIILLHDNIKAEEKLKIILPEILKHFSKKGYSFKYILS